VVSLSQPQLLPPEEDDRNGFAVMPSTKCKLRLVRLERVKDYLLIEEEFIQNQENIKPREEKSAV
jgi:26S proteasome regulatory subunit T2